MTSGTFRMPIGSNLGTLSLSYALGSTGQKSITFLEDRIRVAVHHEETFTEQIPLLVETDGNVKVSSGSVRLGGGSTRLTFDPNARATVKDTGLRVGPKNVVVLSLAARDGLTYTILPSR